MGFLEQFERIRQHLRREISKALIESARAERVEFPCKVCGEVTDVSPSHAEKVNRGAVALPICLDCRSPAKTAQAETAIAAFIDALGDQVDEFSDVLAALR